MKETVENNPLLCNPDSGLCNIPGSVGAASMIETKAQKKPVRILYFTDPICSSCWGIEPQLRRLKLEYGNLIDIEYHMGGLLPSWEVYNSGGISGPKDVAHHWDEVSLHYDMPIDGDVWLEDPLDSSYPPSIAFKAAQMQDPDKALLFLRRIREMVFLEKKNITKWAFIQQAAQETGLDTTRMKTDTEGAGRKAFQDDLALARSYGVRGFPTLFFTDADGNKLTLYGARPYAQFEQNIKALLENAVPAPYAITPEALFGHYPTLTAREWMTLTGMNKKDTENTLNQFVKAQKLHRTDTKNGAIWRSKFAD